MGGWFSSFLTLKSLLYRPKQLAINSIGAASAQANPPDPYVLLSAAAEIAALHRRMEDSAAEPSRVPVSQEVQESVAESSHTYDDTDVEDTMESVLRDRKEQDDSSSDDSDSTDNPCPRLSERLQRELFHKQRQMAFDGRMQIGNYKAYRELREEIEYGCFRLHSVSKNVVNLCSRREFSKPRGGTSTPLGLQAGILNQFLPNCRRIVHKLRSKSFCCLYVKDGTELMVASQDETIRFFEKHGPRDRYFLKDCKNVPMTSWSILDVAMTRSGESLCYGTWKDSVFFGRICKNSWEDDTHISWTELAIPNQDSSMAVFSLRFSPRGHEILCGGSDKSVHIFDLETMSRVTTIHDAHADDVNAVCYGDNDSNLLYSGADDGLVKVYDRRALGEMDYQPVGVFAGHRDGITYIDARGDSRHLLSNSKDQTIKVWDLRRFSSEDTVRKTVNCVRQQSWDYRWQPAPPSNCTLLRGDTSVVTLRGHSVLHTLVRAKFSPERTGRRFIYTGCARGEVVIYDMLANSWTVVNELVDLSPVIRRLPGHVSVVRDVDWNPSSNEIASCAWDGVTAIWRWDERHDHFTSTEVELLGAEDSCDESYQPVVKRRKAALRRSKLADRRRQPHHRPQGSTESPNHELLYTF